MRRMSRIGWARTAVLVLATVAVWLGPTHAANERNFPVDSRPKVYINWETFENNRIPTEWKGQVKNAVINAYTRWNMVAGARVRPRFEGFTTRTDPSKGEILVQMNEKHGTSKRLGSQFGPYNKIRIVLHRKSGKTNTDWNWVPFWAQKGEKDMQAVLMHEFGHALGLDHSAGSRDTMKGTYSWHRGRFGPNSADIDALREIYGIRDTARFGAHCADNVGRWTSCSTNLTDTDVSTTMDPSAARDADRTILFYTTPRKHPAWIIGTSWGDFDPDFSVFGGQDSIYGVSGHGYHDEYMMAWVDPTDDEMRVKVVRSTDGGSSWHWRNPPASSTTIGTPAIRKISGTPDVWVLAYAKLDLDDRTKTGRIVARLSTDDGNTWSDEVELDDAYRANSGVSIADDEQRDIRIGFSGFRWEDRDSAGSQAVQTILATRAGSSLESWGVMDGQGATRTQPALGVTSRGFLLGYRGRNYATSINTLEAPFESTFWGDVTSLPNSTSTSTTPALAAHRSLGRATLYFVSE